MVFLVIAVSVVVIGGAFGTFSGAPGFVARHAVDGGHLAAVAANPDMLVAEGGLLGLPEG